jgi:hypothetical protein
VWTDASGNAYVTGRSSNDAYVWKFDPQGTLSWTKEFATPAFDAGQAIQGDALGNIYIGGVTDGCLMGVNPGDRDAFVAKLDSSGDLQWITQIGTNKSDGVIDLTVDESGNPYISGWTAGILGATNNGERDAYISKLDQTRGNVVFTVQLGTVGEDQANGVAVDGLGNFFATGWVRGDLAGTLSGTEDAFVAKFAVPEPSSAQFLSIAALLLFVSPSVSRRPPLVR